jgi:predicted metal-dependent hydrolase
VDRSQGRRDAEPRAAERAGAAASNSSLTGERFEIEWQCGARRTLRHSDARVRLRRRPIATRARCCAGWLKKAAAERLAPRCCSSRARSNYPVARVAIRCQRTRWGSCSTRGTVSLNCSLLFQRAEVVRYLCVHELAHTKHMNHSRKFWHLVQQLEPDYQRLDRELLAGWRTVPEWVFRA